MFLQRPITWCVLLVLGLSACSLEITRHDSQQVTCSQGLSECTVENEIFLLVTKSDAVDVTNLKPKVMLCCKDRQRCVLCLRIDVEVYVRPDKAADDEKHSGYDEEDYNEDIRNTTGSVSVCYKTPQIMPVCHKVTFMVNHTALSLQNVEQISIVIPEPKGIFFGSQAFLYSSKLDKEVFVPSLDEVCSLELKNRIDECNVPSFSTEINRKLDQVELHFSDSNQNLPSVCIRHEHNGKCKPWNGTTIPLHSVTSCLCFEVWVEDDQSSPRSRSCPFEKHHSSIFLDFFQRNIWDNVSVSVSRGQMNDDGMMLLWNMSAPCRLEGEVWPCERSGAPEPHNCREITGFKQTFTKHSQKQNDMGYNWRQNEKGLWVKNGVFQQINLQKSPCVMVKVKGMSHALGPVCYENTDRWRWNMFIVAVIFFICLTVLTIYLVRNSVKRVIGRWYRGGFIKIAKKGGVLLLSPPDADGEVSDLVSCLGSLLHNRGISVTVDQWSRKGQWTSGPLLWYYSQLSNISSQGSRVVLVLTQKALEKAEEWTDQHSNVINTKLEEDRLPQTFSPYSDVFTASLLAIKAYKNRGIAGKHFLLVKYDSHWPQSTQGDRRLPELLQGLPVFQFPSQTDALLSELTVGRSVRGKGRKTQWKQSGETEKVSADQQKATHCKYFGAQKNLETEPLKQPQS